MTPNDAASGIANNHPKANSGNMSQIGLSLTRRPITRGDST
jgi:hypothetical protein